MEVVLGLMAFLPLHTLYRMVKLIENVYSFKLLTKVYSHCNLSKYVFGRMCRGVNNVVIVIVTIEFRMPRLIPT